MVNPERGEVEIVVNEKPYTLKLTINAAVAIQKRLGKTLPQVMTSAQLGDIEAIRCFFWACLQKYHAKQFQAEEVAGNLMDDAGESLQKALEELTGLNKPEQPIAPSEVGGNPPEAPTTGTGESSISVLAKSA